MNDRKSWRTCLSCTSSRANPIHDLEPLSKLPIKELGFPVLAQASLAQSCFGSSVIVLTVWLKVVLAQPLLAISAWPFWVEAFCMLRHSAQSDVGVAQCETPKHFITTGIQSWNFWSSGSHHCKVNGYSQFVVPHFFHWARLSKKDGNCFVQPGSWALCVSRRW